METTRRPAWREPMVWLVAALPLGAVAASAVLIAMASRGGSIDAVADPVRRTAQVQVADLGPDARAQQLRLRAILRIDADLVEVLPVTGAFQRGAPLRLALRHPNRAAADRVLQLQPGEAGWRATAAALDTAHAWKLELASADGAWRIQGRLPAGQRAAHLQSAWTDDETPP